MNTIFIVLAVLYAGFSKFTWATWRKSPESKYLLRSEIISLIPVILLQTSFLLIPVLHDRVLSIGFGNALNLVVWLMVLMYWSGSFFYPLRGLQLLLYPIATLCMLIAAFLPGQSASYSIHNVPFMLHISSALLAYGLFAMSTLLAILMLIANRQLHKKQLSQILTTLPPLLSIEKLMFKTILIGFILLSIAVMSGTVFSEAVFGQPAMLTHKNVFGIISWLMYALILFKRYRQAWRGKTAALWVIGAFACLFLAYIGSKFVLEIILHH